MNGKSTKIFIIVFVVLFILSIAASFFKYIIIEDYEVYLPEENEGVIE